MWRLRVVHSTGYAYKSAVTASFNEARLTPRSDSRQNVILNRVETIPATRSYRYVDYWGTAVTAFDLHAPHTELEVSGSSVVETEIAEKPEETVGWDDLRTEAVIDRFDEVLSPTHYTPHSKRIARVGQRIAKDHDPFEAVGRWRSGCAANSTTYRVPPACTPRAWMPCARVRVCARISRTCR
ncbi:transglutaminase-like protein [Mycolicibacterium fortuitum]|uniref:Transglutaminase-like protein n=1 Tax=Mycolicibacterium fortuitum TaxID=1766 RepID=A0A378USK7_MYCFO|nr:transglutaminase-like protein [Mycolicibacterium fortuitum]